VFEPDSQTARDLAKNIEINKLTELVTLHQMALSAQDGQLAFTSGLGAENHVASPDAANVQTVPACRLDSIAKNVTPIMMKLDVEGHEEQVLRGAHELLKRPALKLLEIETVTPWLSAHLQERGFIRAYYAPLTRKLTHEPNGERAANQLYVRDREFVQGRFASARPIEVFGRRF
jgi:FkbM family methyltransferase